VTVPVAAEGDTVAVNVTLVLVVGVVVEALSVVVVDVVLELDVVLLEAVVKPPQPESSSAQRMKPTSAALRWIDLASMGVLTFPCVAAFMEFQYTTGYFLEFLFCFGNRRLPALLHDGDDFGTKSESREVL
jgi:hypothetical protein